MKISHQRGGEPCPQWTPQQIGYGRSFSCSFWWQRFPHTVRRPPRWAARWRSRADRRQIPSYTLEGVPWWPEAEGLSNMEKGKKRDKIISIEGWNPQKTFRLQLVDSNSITEAFWVKPYEFSLLSARFALHFFPRDFLFHLYLTWGRQFAFKDQGYDMLSILPFKKHNLQCGTINALNRKRK